MSQAPYYLKTFALAVPSVQNAIPLGMSYMAGYFSFFKSKLKFYPLRKAFPNLPN